MAETTRANAASLLTEQKATDILGPAMASSVVLSTFENIPMSKKVYRQPLVGTLPTASFVTDGTSDGQSAASGTKPTTNMTWTDKALTAEELAVIVPIHENLLADADTDLWAQIMPRVAEAFAVALDNAVLFGTNAPASWTDANIVGKATTATQKIVDGAATKTDLALDLNSVMAKVEAAGYDVDTILAIRSLKARFRRPP